MKIKLNQACISLGLGAILTIALLLRANGMFRGLTYDYSFHPDVPKQIAALGNFLQDKYVWYVGSLFYDGYPLGLNHLDEWLLRGFMALRQTVVMFILPEAQPLGQPEKITLYYWVHSLRLLYSLCCLGLLYHLTRKILQDQTSALMALLLAGIAPLAIVVSHMASGDIGVDLFTLISFTCLAAYTRQSRKGWFLAAGLATGLAFSCKYQGALAALATGLFILLELAHDRRIRGALASLSLFCLGAFSGILAGTPAAFINWGRTWKYMQANFEFIRHYNVNPEFLALPVMTRVLYSLTANTPVIVNALGWSITLTALGGLVHAALQLRMGRRDPSRDSTEVKTGLLVFSLLAFPFLALLVSIAGKPEVQPFHFSYLQPLLVFGAVYALRQLWISPRRFPKLLAGFLLVMAISESAYITRREAFFWGRSDNRHWARNLPAKLFTPTVAATHSAGIIKTIDLEPGGPAVFRNRATSVNVPEAEFWNQTHIAPVPNFPLSMDEDWLFPNGPVFPRNDRYFKVSKGVAVSRHVVLYAPPTAFQFGLRCGSWPARVTLSYGGDKRLLTLTPHSQTNLALTPRWWKTSMDMRGVPGEIFLVPLDVQTEGGNAWVTLLADRREARVFDFYGGKICESGELTAGDIPTQAQCDALEEVRFIEGEGAPADITPETGWTHGLRFPEEGLALPCGPYLAEFVLDGQSPASELTLKLDDYHKCDALAPYQGHYRLGYGPQVITARFTKAFAPFETQLELKVVTGRCRLVRWSIRPDVDQIRQDLENLRKGAATPSWLSTGKRPPDPESAWDKAPITFGDGLRLTRLSVPATLSTGKDVIIPCELSFEKFGLAHFEDYVFFIHLLDNQGHTVHTFNFPLWQTFALGSLNIPFHFDPPAQLPPGQYGLELGLYNARIGKRLPIAGRGIPEQEQRKRHYTFGRTLLELPTQAP